MFLDSAAKNYPGTLWDQNKYDTFDNMANPSLSILGCATWKYENFFSKKLLFHPSTKTKYHLSLPTMTIQQFSKVAMIQSEHEIEIGR